MFKAIELRQESFLWAKDLSTYDNPIRLPFEVPFLGSVPIDPAFVMLRGFVSLVPTPCVIWYRPG